MAKPWILLRIAGFTAAVGAWLALIAGQVGNTTPTIQWTADNYHAKEAIAASMPAGKVIVVGGSSVLYGIRADDMTAALRRPVVNFGNNAALGLHYVLARADRAIGKDDVVVLALEYELYRNEMMGAAVIDLVLADDPDYLRELRPVQLADAASQVTMERILMGYGLGCPPYFPSRIHGYLQPHLDGNGDELRNNLLLRSGAAKVAAGNPVMPPEIAPDNAAVLATNIRRWQARGARVIAVPPPLLDLPAYHEPDWLAGARRIASFHETNGVAMPVLPWETLYGPRDFFDTQYHLDVVAAHRHTAFLIERLSPLVAPAGAMPSWTPRAADNDLARFVERFRGWQWRSGPMRIDESDPSREPFVRVDPGTLGIAGRTADAGAARLQARIRSNRPTTLAIRGPHGTETRSIPAGEDIAIEMPLGRVADGDALDLVHEGTLEISTMILSWEAPPRPPGARGGNDASPPR